MPDPAPAPAPAARDCTERLWPPPLYWLTTTALVATVFWVLAVSTPAPVVAVGTAVAAVFAFGGLVAIGSVRVGVRDGRFVAGRAQIPLELCGAVRALDAAETRRVRGVDADARAFLVLRPYLPCCVRVDIDDPADPTPYWLVSARRPDPIAAAATGTGSSRRDDPRTAR